MLLPRVPMVSSLCFTCWAINRLMLIKLSVMPLAVSVKFSLVAFLPSNKYKIKLWSVSHLGDIRTASKCLVSEFLCNCPGGNISNRHFPQLLFWWWWRTVPSNKPVQTSCTEVFNWVEIWWLRSHNPPQIIRLSQPERQNPHSVVYRVFRCTHCSPTSVSLNITATTSRCLRTTALSQGSSKTMMRRPMKEEVRQLEVWCDDKNLCLNVSKTEKTVVDFRRTWASGNWAISSFCVRRSQTTWHAQWRYMHVWRCMCTPVLNCFYMSVRERSAL